MHAHFSNGAIWSEIMLLQIIQLKSSKNFKNFGGFEMMVQPQKLQYKQAFSIIIIFFVITIVIIIVIDVININKPETHWLILKANKSALGWNYGLRFEFNAFYGYIQRTLVTFSKKVNCFALKMLDQ